MGVRYDCKRSEVEEKAAIYCTPNVGYEAMDGYAYLQETGTCIESRGDKQKRRKRGGCEAEKGMLSRCWV